MARWWPRLQRRCRTVMDSIASKLSPGQSPGIGSVEASSTIRTEADHLEPEPVRSEVVRARSIRGRSRRSAPQSLKLGIRMRIDSSSAGIGTFPTTIGALAKLLYIQDPQG